MVAKIDMFYLDLDLKRGNQGKSSDRHQSTFVDFVDTTRGYFVKK